MFRFQRILALILGACGKGGGSVAIVEEKVNPVGASAGGCLDPSSVLKDKEYYFADGTKKR